MVDKYPNEPHGEGEVPFFDDAEFNKQFSRIEKLTTAHLLLAKAYELDAILSDSGVTKKFVNKSAGTVLGGNYPFYHIRVKLKPKNRTVTDIKVAALRFPSQIGLNSVQLDKLYIAFEDSLGDHIIYLSPDQCSAVDPQIAFKDPGQGSVIPPGPDGLYQASDMELLAIEEILGLDSIFEPDLQPNNPDIKA